VHTLLYLLYVLYWPDDGRLVSTCSPFGEQKIGGFVRIKALSEHLNAADVQQMTVAAFNVTHFEFAIVLVWVVGGDTDNGGWVPHGLGFSEQWNVGPCSSAYFVWNSSY